MLALGLGVGVALIHAAVRMPLHLPGRQGLAAVALLLLARKATRLRLGASLAGVAAFATGAGALSVGPVTALAYVLGGALIDAAFVLAPSASGRLWASAALGGLANTAQVLLLALGALWLPSATSHLGTHVVWFLGSHLAFGAAGGVLAFALWKWRWEH